MIVDGKTEGKEENKEWRIVKKLKCKDKSRGQGDDYKP